MLVAKATESTTFTDPQYAGNKARAAAKGFHFAAYHVLHPGNIAAQAAYAFKVVGSTPLMLDIEHWASGNPSIADVLAFVAAYRKLGGVIGVLYLPRWYWRQYWGSTTCAQLVALGLVNIDSNYTTAAGGPASPALQPMGGMRCVGVQYTDTPHDQNVSYLALSELWAHFTYRPPTPAPKPPAIPVHANASRTLVLTSPVTVGTDVETVQHIVGAPVDGKYGPGTVAKVEAWQTREHLASDGKFGPASWGRAGYHYTGK